MNKPSSKNNRSALKAVLTTILISLMVISVMAFATTRAASASTATANRATDTKSPTALPTDSPSPTDGPMTSPSATPTDSPTITTSPSPTSSPQGSDTPTAPTAPPPAYHQTIKMVVGYSGQEFIYLDVLKQFSSPYGLKLCKPGYIHTAGGDAFADLAKRGDRLEVSLSSLVHGQRFAYYTVSNRAGNCSDPSQVTTGSFLLVSKPIKNAKVVKSNRPGYFVRVINRMGIKLKFEWNDDTRRGANHHKWLKPHSRKLIHIGLKHFYWGAGAFPAPGEVLTAGDGPVTFRR